jgi:hypothetical protein
MLPDGDCLLRVVQKPRATPWSPTRILNDIALLSPAELLKFLQHLNLSPITGDPHLINLIEAACQAQLLDSTDFTQLKETRTTGYLSGRASANELIQSRIQMVPEDWLPASQRINSLGELHPDERFGH